MINEIENNSIVICSNRIKKEILLNCNYLKKIKFITIEEFIKNYYGTYKTEAIYYVMEKYGYTYDVAKEYLDNIFYNYEPLKDMYYDLECNDLLIVDELFKKEVLNKKIYVIGYYNLDKYVVDTLKELNVIFINNNNKCIHDVYEFKTMDDEIVFVINDIIKNHKDNIKDVYLVNIDNTYNNSIKRLFKLFNLNINLKENNSIYAIKEVQEFVKYLKEKNSINLDLINNVDIKNKIIDNINKYNITNIDNHYIDILESNIKNCYIDNITYDNAVNVIDIEDMFLDDKYYYIMNFNQGSVPKVFSDDKLIKDSNRSILGLNTSLDCLNNYKKMVIHKLNNYKNITITYKLNDYFKSYIKSPLVDELKLNVIKDIKLEYNYSNKYNKLELAKMLDDHSLFNIECDNLNDLYATYSDINYSTYNNEFSGLDNNLLKEYLNNSINISYSSMDSFFKCQFRYYIDNILRLGAYENTNKKLIGNLFHDVLSKMYNEDFDLKKEYNDYLKDKELTNKEKFYVDKVYSELELIIDTIKNHDKHSKYSEVLTEYPILIKKDSNLDIHVKGYIDKIKILRNNNNIYVSIIDYKTGNTDLSLDNINYGLNMQLPMYLYLIKKDMNNVNVIGFYLQKILENKKLNSKDKKKDELDSLKLLGYTIDNEGLIPIIDDTYTCSDVIKSMKITKNGFYKYAKLITM